MDVKGIERMVMDALELQGLDHENKEKELYAALHHALIAVGCYALLPPWFQQKFDEISSVISEIFRVKIKLKKNEKKKKKKMVPPTPPSIKEEKEEKLKEYDTHTIACAMGGSKGLKERKEEFRLECKKYKGTYPDTMVDKFFKYWSQANRKSGLMRFELQDVFDVDARLESWSTTRYTLSDEETALKKQRRLAPKKSQPADTAKQQEIAREREEANRKREEEFAEAKRGAVTMEEALGRNPTGALGKLMKTNNKNQ